jgi:hypothetical protein
VIIVQAARNIAVPPQSRSAALGGALDPLIEVLLDQLPLAVAHLLEMLAEGILADGLGREVEIFDLLELGRRRRLRSGRRLGATRLRAGAGRRDGRPT